MALALAKKGGIWHRRHGRLSGVGTDGQGRQGRANSTAMASRWRRDPSSRASETRGIGMGVMRAQWAAFSAEETGAGERRDDLDGTPLDALCSDAVVRDEGDGRGG